jgi:nucleoside-diphosphate-sugar epimerase
MNILILGGAGYIGSILCDDLLNWIDYGLWSSIDQCVGDGTRKLIEIPDYTVVKKLIVYDNLSRKQNTLGAFCDDPRFEFVHGSVTDIDLVVKTLEEYDIDTVIYLAGLVGFPVCEKDKALAWTVNYQAFSAIISELGPKHKLLTASTNSGYGSRPDGKPVTEDDPLNPISTYGLSKVAAEQVVLEVGGVSLRLATCMGYSPCMRLDLLVNNFVWKAAKDREITLYEKGFRRNYIHVRDVSQAFILGIKKYDEMSGKAFNVGLSEANLTKEDLAKEIAKYTELHILEAPLMKDPDKRDCLVSNERIESMGFRPMWDMERTIKQLLKFYKTIKHDSGNVYYDNWR